MSVFLRQDHKSLFWRQQQLLLLLLWVVYSSTTTTVSAMDCGCPATCTRHVLGQWKPNMHFSCEMRIAHFMSRYGDSEETACRGASTGADAPCPKECNPDLCKKTIADDKSALQQNQEQQQRQAQLSVVPPPKQQSQEAAAASLRSNTNPDGDDVEKPLFQQIVFIVLTMTLFGTYVRRKNKKKFLKSGDSFTASNKDTSSRRETFPRSVRARLKR